MVTSEQHDVLSKRGGPPALLSVVCPVYNEVETLLAFHRRLRKAMRDLGQPFEVVFVNDGSNDGSHALMKDLRARHANTTIVNLSRNFGKEVAMTAGLDHARGDAVVLIDADLQHPPEAIGDLITGWREGFDVVNAVRRHRDNESWARRRAANVFYRLMGRLGKVAIPEDAGDFRLLSRNAVNAVTKLREHHRFMKGVFAWVGFPTTSVQFDVAPRFAGTTKYDFWKLWNFSIEGLTSHTLAPLKVSTYLGLVVAIFSFGSGAFYIAKTILFGDPVPGFPTVVTTVLFLGGVQLMVLGVMGEYLGRVFNETKNRPLYFTTDVIEADSVASGSEDISDDEVGRQVA